MLNSFSPSGQKSPCPICGRTKDGDCRILSDGRVFCHTAKSGIKGKKCDSNEIYIYLGKSDEAQGAGMWKLDEAAPAKTHRAKTQGAKTPRQYGIRYFDYFFWDGAAVPAQRYRKDVEGQPKEVKWAKGGLAGRSQNEVAPYLWEKASGAKQLFVVRGELKAELLAGKGFAAISLLNQKDEVLVSKLQAMRADGVEIVLVPDCDEADLDKWFRYLSNEVSGVKQLLAPGLPWANPPVDGGLGVEDWIYAKSPSNEQILAAISSMGESGLSSNEKNLVTLEEKIQTIVDKHEDPLKRSALIKKEASELGFSFTAAEVNGFISGVEYQEPIPYDHSNPQPYQEEPKLWGNLFLHQATNLLVAAPKVGKSALALHLFGCMLRGESHCLGQPIHNRCSTLIIAGGDMGISQWHKLLIREGLATVVNGMVHIVPEVILFPKGTKIQLTSQGIKTIGKLCINNPNAMLLVDTFRSQTECLGYEENSRDAVRPFERLFETLAASKSGATPVVIHHTKKDGNSNAVKSSSGSGATPGAFDQTLNMNWLVPDPIGLQLDKRILINSSGRGGEDQQIVVELVGKAPAPVRWIGHGNAAELVKAEAIIAAEEALGPQRAKVYDQGQTLYENSGKGLVYRPVMELLQCTKQVARRHLAAIHRTGLFIRIGQQHSGYSYYPHWAERIEERSTSTSADLGGGATPKGATDPPSNLQDLDQSSFLKNEGNPPSQKDQPCLPLETEFSTGSSDPSTSVDTTEWNRVEPQWNPQFTPPDPLVSLNGTGGNLPFVSSSSSLKEPIPTSFLAGSLSNERALYVNDSANDTETLKPQLEQAVQVFRKGEWESGWTICDSRNPHSLRIRTERDGKVFQLANQRWEIDLRPEPLEVPASPSKADARATELDTSSEDLQRASISVEMPATDAERDSFF